jgi:hypothetical protein
MKQFRAALASVDVKRIRLVLMVAVMVSVFMGSPLRTEAATNTGGSAASLQFPSFFFGDAKGCYPPNPELQLHAPMVALALTPDAGGNWQAAGDGGVFTCGNAHFYGSAGNVRLNAPVVGMAATRDGRGYWLVAADGGVFNFGDAHDYGSAGMLGRAPITGIAATPSGLGYWLSGADAGVFAYGDAHFYGSQTGFGTWPDPIGGITATRDGRGYVLFLCPPRIEPNLRGPSGFDLARRNYLGNGYYSEALHGLFLDQAALYLQLGAQSHPGTLAGYSSAIAELGQLAAIPNMVTPAQAAESARLTAELDAFFGTPGFEQG